jgi:tetratricopeptide (TPR) repeat protein
MNAGLETPLLPSHSLSANSAPGPGGAGFSYENDFGVFDPAASGCTDGAAAEGVRHASVRRGGVYPVLTALLIVLPLAMSGADEGIWHSKTQEGNRLLAAGRYAEAESSYREALRAAGQFGSKSPRLAHSLNNVAAACHELGRQDEALKLFERALGLWESYGPEESRNRAVARANLAVEYWAAGRYAEAQAMNQKALRELNPQSVEAGFVHINLAELFRDRGQLEEAEASARRALDVLRGVSGEWHGNTATVLHTLATVHRAAGRNAEAEELLERVVAVREKTLGPEHPLVAAALSNLAEVRNTQQRYAEAESVSRRALAIWEKTLGPEHRSVATGLNGLAQSLRLLKRYEEAETLYHRTIEVAEKTLGTAHPETARFYANFGHLYLERGRYAGAAKLYERALRIIAPTARPNHPHVETITRFLALAYRGQGRIRESERLMEGFSLRGESGEAKRGSAALTAGGRRGDAHQ